MSALRTSLRWLMWTAIVILAAPVVLYVLALAVNWRDQPPNAEALELAAAAARDPIPDAMNAYVFALGFAAPRVADPAFVGGTRAEWIRALAANPDVNPASDPYPGSAPDFQQIPEPLAAVLTPCAAPDAACVMAFENAGSDLRAQLELQRSLIDRYRTLLGYRAWQEVTTGDLRGPLAPYAEVGYARRLFLLDTWLLAVTGDATEVRARLGADLALWRMVLAAADSLNGKGIASSFVGQHFTWGNLILRRLPPERRADGVPEGWRKSLTDAERSIHAAFVGELRYVNNTTLLLKRGPAASSAGANQPSMLDRVSTRLQLNLLQPQATANRYAAMLAKLEMLLKVPYAELGAALARAPETDDAPSGVLAATYNVAGNAIATPQPALLASYAARVADLEGARRAAVLTVDLRVLKIPAEFAGAMVPLAASRDPYTGGPFTWTAAPAMVTFTGLEPTNGTRHRFLY